MAGTWTAAAAATAALLALAGCAQSTGGRVPAAGSALLAEHGLAGMTGKEVVDHLDRLPAAERPADLLASVRAEEVVLTDGTEEVALDLPADEFYVSVAPYVDATHECYYHSLTTCQGELVEQEVDVTLTTDDGEVLLAETTTTLPNGFVGYWLPRDVEGVLEVTHDGLTGSVPLATGPDDPTCVTTLRLG